jgi:hypothetical protein
MRAGYNEALATLGYVLGMVATSLPVGWPDGEAVNEVRFTCSLLFEVAFLLGLVRFFFRGLRWGGRVFVRRWRMAVTPEPSE